MTTCLVAVQLYPADILRQVDRTVAVGSTKHAREAGTGVAWPLNES